MAQAKNFEVITIERFVGDYFFTFVRLLDPNLSPRAPTADANPDDLSWGTIGQKAALCTLAIGCLAVSLAGLFLLLA